MNILKQLKESKKILIAAHRGCSGVNIPCNTIDAFKIAIKGGADIVEMDLFKSADGKIFIFHTGKEPYLLNKHIDLTQMTSHEIATLRLVNADFNETDYGICTFDSVLEELKDKCIINIDRAAEIIPDVMKIVRRHKAESQILLKTNPEEKYINIIKNVCPDIMYMPIYFNKDEHTEKLITSGINMVGAELVFDKETDPIASTSYIEEMHNKGMILWGNGVVYNTKVLLAAGHNDDISMTTDPDLGWGWLISHGFDIIQTDWTYQLNYYINGN